MTRTKIIVRELRRLFPTVRCPLTYHEPWQLIVAVVLSAQCTDAQVNKVTPQLFSDFPTIESLAHARATSIEKRIYSTGFYRSKTRSIIGLARQLEKTHGEIPRTVRELTQLPGVGRKTANVVLGELYGIAEGIAVDTHVIRLSRRLGLTKAQKPEAIEKELMQRIPKGEWISFPHRLMAYGRTYCPAKQHNHSLCPLARFHVE